MPARVAPNAGSAALATVVDWHIAAGGNRNPLTAIALLGHGEAVAGICGPTRDAAVAVGWRSVG